MNTDKVQAIDLLLINTPQYDYSIVPSDSYVSLPPLGLAFIGTWLENRRFSVKLLDSELHGHSPNLISSMVNKAKPRFLGLNLLTPTYHIVTKILEGIDSSITVAVGGAHANAFPREILNDPKMRKVKYLVLGDGEFKMESLLKGDCDIEHIPGLAFRKNGDVVVNVDRPLDHNWNPSNLDDLPFINRKLLDSDPFYSEGRLEATMIAARGCPYTCSFCSASNDIAGSRPRVRSIENIIKEIQYLHEAEGVTAIRFVDDLLLRNIAYIRAFTSAIVDSGLSEHLVWQANVRVNTLCNAPNDLFEQLVLSGCRQLSIGIESGSQRILDYVSKRITPDQVRTLVKKLSRYGIRASGYFILGFPDETYEETVSTISLFHELREISRNNIKESTAMFRGNLFEFRPYPNTIEWQKLLLKGFSVEEMLNSYKPLVIDGLDERMKRRWSSSLQIAESCPSEIQQLIKLALLKQNEDLIKHQALPDFAWNSTT